MYDPYKHHRRSIRIKEYDYSQGGAYFVTICVHDRECGFGEILDWEMRLSSVGEIARQCWLEIPNHFSNIELDEYVIMPNHVHGIIIIPPNTVGVQHVEPLQSKFQHIIPQSMGSIVRQYKSAATRTCRQRGHEQFRWQRNYYEHIIRDQKDLNTTRRYIHDNPAKWYLDKENPDNIQRISA